MTDIVYNMPTSTLLGLIRYRDQHCPTGSFLEAVLQNNLKEAFIRADEDNREALHEIVKFCYWELPSEAWGSPEKVNRWLEIGASNV